MRLAGTYEYDEALAERILHALAYGNSDKSTVHQYHKVYAHILAGRTIDNFLEIGLFFNPLSQTSDITAWSAIYPESNIYGADIKEELLFDRDNIRTMRVDQASEESLQTLKNVFAVEFDIIIDDASHEYDKTINTFVNLFPVVKAGGVYVIEDCQGQSTRNNTWQQTVLALETYFSDNGYTFEVFESRKPRKMLVAPVNGSTEGIAPSDDYIICIYKQ